MNRLDIVNRINQKMYEELYSYEDIKYDLDDAIIAINNTLNAKFPMMSDVLNSDSDEYPHFPDKYVRSVVIEFTVASLFRRQGDFTNEYNSAITAYENGLAVMFSEYYESVPAEYMDNQSGIIPITHQPLDLELDVNGQPIPGTEPDDLSEVGSLWPFGDY